MSQSSRCPCTTRRPTYYGAHWPSVKDISRHTFSRVFLRNCRNCFKVQYMSVLQLVHTKAVKWHKINVMLKLWCNVLKSDNLQTRHMQYSIHPSRVNIHTRKSKILYNQIPYKILALGKHPKYHLLLLQQLQMSNEFVNGVPIYPRL